MLRTLIKNSSFNFLPILLLWVVWPVAMHAQSGCPKYEEAMKAGQAFMEQEIFDKALIEFQAAQIAARECHLDAQKAKAPAEKIQAAIQGIQQQKENAEKAAADARRANKRAQNLLKQTQEANEEIQALLEKAEESTYQAERNSRANKNALTALQLEKTDPTKALRVAEMNYRLFPESGTANGILLELLKKQSSSYLELKAGHARRIIAAAFSKDGQYILTTDRYKSEILWNLKGEELQRFPGVGSLIDTILILPNNTYVKPTEPILQLPSSKSANIITFDRKANPSLIGDDTYAESPDYTVEIKKEKGSLDRYFVISDNSSGKEIERRPYGTYGVTTLISFMTNKKIFVFHKFSDQDRYAEYEIMEIQEDRVVVQVEEAFPYKRVTDAILSPDGKSMLVLANNTSPVLMDLNGEVLQTFTGGHANPITALSFSTDGKNIISGDLDNSIRLWDLEKKQVRPLRMELDGAVTLSSPDIIAVGNTTDHKMIVAQGNNSIGLYDYNGDYKSISPPSNNPRKISLAAFATEDQAIVYVNKSDTTAIVRNFEQDSLALLVGHSKFIKAVACTPNGQIYLTGSSDSTAILWSRDGKIKHILKGHTGSVDAVDISSNGQYIITGSADNSARLWDQNGNVLNTFNNHTGDIIKAIFSPDGQYIFTSSSDKTAILWDLEGNIIQAFRNNRSIDQVAFAPDGQSIITSSKDEKIKIWPLTMRTINAFEGHTKDIDAIAFSPDGKYIFTGSQGRDQNAILWDRAGNILKMFKGHSNSINAAAFSPNGEYLAAISHDRTTIWKMDGNVQAAFRIKDAWCNAISFSPDGASIFIVDEKSRKVGHWNLDGKPQETFSFFNWEKRKYRNITFSPDRKTILTTHSDSIITLWNLNGDSLQTFTGHDSRINAIAFSPDGQFLLTGGSDSTIVLSNLNGERLNSFKTNGYVIRALAFAPDQQSFISVDQSGSLIHWGLDGVILDKSNTYVLNIGFAPDGQFFFADKSSLVSPWEFNGRKPQTFERKNKLERATILISPDGQSILKSNEGASLWSMEGKEITQFGIYRIEKMAFSLKGDTILFGLEGGDVVLVSPTGEILKTLDGDNNRVFTFAFSPDRQSFAAVNYNKELIIRSINGDTLHKRSLRSLFLRQVWKLAFSPDGKSIMFNNNSSLYLWQIQQDSIISLTSTPNVDASVFSPNGEHIVTIDERNKISLIDLKDKTRKTLIEVSSDFIFSSVAFAPDGNTILATRYPRSGSRYSTLLLLDLNGNVIKEFPPMKIFMSSYTPNGEKIVTITTDNKIIQYYNFMNFNLSNYYFQQYSLNALRTFGLEFTERDLKELEKR